MQIDKCWLGDSKRCVGLCIISHDACNLTPELERTVSSVCNGRLHLKWRSQRSLTGEGAPIRASLPNSHTLEWGRVETTKPSSCVCSNGHNLIDPSCPPTQFPFGIADITLTLLQCIKPTLCIVEMSLSNELSVSSFTLWVCCLSQRTCPDVERKLKTKWSTQEKYSIQSHLYAGIILQLLQIRGKLHSLTLCSDYDKWFCKLQMINHETGFSGNKEDCQCAGTDLSTTCHNLILL